MYHERRVWLLTSWVRPCSIVDHTDEILEAVKADLGKGTYEAQMSEVQSVQNEIIYITKNLAKWAQDEKPEPVPFMYAINNPKVRKDPLGCVLVIGPFNLPFNLTFCPLLGAIAGGNTAVVKPSEQVPASAAVIAKIISQTLDPDCFRVVQGGVQQTQALLAEKWDKIFFTGSANVGRIVAKAAAPNLTPVILELGGKNPAFVTKKANTQLAARRLLWGKTFNVGQVCLSQNVIFVDEEVVPTFVAGIKDALAEFFPHGAKQSPDYGRIVSDRQFDRIKKMLDSTSGQIVIGGKMDATERFIEPTVVQVSDASDPLIVEESFGPLITILPMNNLDEAIHLANSIDSTPLALYPYGSKQEVAQVIRETRSGGVSINDCYTHAVIPHVAFGGVGESGTGSYRGRASFDSFVHRRIITNTPNWLEKSLSVRYPPSEGKLAKYSKMTLEKPDFDRDGNVKFNLLRYILTFGGGTIKGGLVRASLLAAFAFVLQTALNRTR